MNTSIRSAKSSLRILPLLGLLLAIAGVIMACGGTSDNSGSVTTGGGSSSTSSAQHFTVGQQVKVGSTWVVTVNSAKTHGATDIDQPKSGNTYLVVDVSLKNVSSQEQTLSSLAQFTLKDATGQSYDETITTFANAAPDGKVEAGSVSRGQMVYEVPTAQKSFTFAFEADIVSGGQTIWDISI
ncbi:MAG: DUF4352 domain-containing protein [Ktedonobacterales bacterium]